MAGLCHTYLVVQWICVFHMDVCQSCSKSTCHLQYVSGRIKSRWRTVPKSVFSFYLLEVLTKRSLMKTNDFPVALVTGANGV